MKYLVKFLSILFIFSFLKSIAGSYGDKLPIFVSCFDSCTNDLCHPQDGSSLTPLPPALRLLRWSCSDNCKYECMIPIYESMKQNSPETGPVQQFFGKWPFYRVLGIQEFASFIFSILNGWMHYNGYKLITKTVPNDAIFRNFYYTNAILSINVWIWSAIFHARDTYFTEKMDYFSAYLAILYSLYFAILRIFFIRPSLNSPMFIGLTVFFVLAYIHHLVVMTQNFDYFYNMLVGLVGGVSHNLLWIGWSIFQPGSKSPHQGRWFPAQCAILISLALLFEVFDFPPISGYVDAHSCWHLSTVFIIPLWYRFFKFDSNYLRHTNKAFEKQSFDKSI